ncbi:hypothetical protein R1sor_005356 [Riccia sorocarpa]|uniref:Uncharacterized protein n=1 Tax=Riccia sorocarpa TaxID=122646 RepID=A0ABD3HN48_9MARC
MPEGHEALHLESRRKYENWTTVYVLALSIMAVTTGLLFGYDLGISGGVSAMPDFQKKLFPSVLRNAKVNNYGRYDSQTVQLFTLLWQTL